MPGDLRAVDVPTPPNLDDFVRDLSMARALGKALFWDMQVGSDGVQACASCHFRAGADPRSKNQVSPGLKRVPDADLTYSTATGANRQLETRDFPLTRLANPGIRGALDPATDSNDAVSSQGIHHPGNTLDPQGFRVGGANTRRVEPRNTPSVINAVFNHRQFWDGRAENIFNGVNHLGQRDPDAKLFRADDPRRPVEAREEDELSNNAAIAGYNAFCSSFESKMNEEINKLGLANQELSQESITAIESAVREVAEDAMTSASADLVACAIMGWVIGPIGIISIGAPDDVVGSANFRYTHDQLAKHGQAFFDMRWENEGEWRIFGHISAEPVPQLISNFGPIIGFDQEEMAMRDFRHRAELAEREGFIGAFPNFYTATYGRSNVGGTIFIASACGEFRDVRLVDLGDPPPDDFAERFRATQRYASKHGFVGGFPNFFHADYSSLSSRIGIIAPQ